MTDNTYFINSFIIKFGNPTYITASIFIRSFIIIFNYLANTNPFLIK